MLQLSRILIAWLVVVGYTANLFSDDQTDKAALHTGESNRWHIGVGRAKITPQEPMWMAGYASRNEPSKDVLTDLWAKSLLIEDDSGNRILLVTLDLVGIERTLSQEICKELHSRFSMERNQISLATSHTHSGPVVGKNLHPMHVYQLSEEHQAKVAQYAEWLKNQIVLSVGMAMESRQPASLHYGTGLATFATNRRNNPETEATSRRTAGGLVGPVDHSVPVLVAKNSDDRAIAIVFGYACHATVLSGYRICGDYPGFAQIEIESRFPGCTAMFWAGCGADQNPLPRRTEELAEHYGRTLGQAVESVVRTHELLPITGELSSQYNEIPLAFAESLDRETWLKRTESADKYEAMRAKRLVSEFDATGSISTTYPYPVQTWRLGKEIEWIHLGGEVVVDFAARLKSERHGERTWVTGYANDVMAYIPSRRVLREGGYEGGSAMVYYGLPSPWADTIEEDIVAEVGKQLK